MKRLLSVLLCAIMCLTAGATFTACDGGGKNDDGPTTVIRIVTGSGGLGRAYIENAAKRFEEAKAGEVYEEGKMGVTIEVITDGYGGDLNSQESNNYHIYTEGAEEMAVAEMVRNQQILPITDIVTEKFEKNEEGVDVSIEDKMTKELREMLQVGEANGTKEYYGVPIHDYSSGLTLDENAANRYGFFFHEDQTPDSPGVKFTSQILNKDFYFVDGTGGEGGEAPECKSAGPDLEPGTQDDGQPRSINELVAYCEYIKSQDKYPFVCAGMYVNMHFFMIQGLVNSLLGFDHARAYFDFEAEDFEIVTGFTDEQLWPGFKTAYDGQCKDYSILKPITTKVDITLENAYYLTWSSAQYYAHAFTDLAYKMDWFTSRSYNSSHDQRSAMRDFYLSGFDPSVTEEPIMLLEMTFWPNESKLSYIPESFDMHYNHDNHIPRQHLWMSLPTVFYSDDEPGAEPDQNTKTRQTFQTSTTSIYVISKFTEKYPGKLRAAKEFLQFTCSNEEGDLHTLEVGLRKPYKYTVQESTYNKIPYFFGKLAELIDTNVDVVYEYSTSKGFTDNPQLNSTGYWGDRWTVIAKIKGVINRYDATEYYRDYMSVANPMDGFTNATWSEGTPLNLSWFRLKENWEYALNAPADKAVAYYPGTQTPVEFVSKAK